jgi:hypothetical protein
MILLILFIVLFLVVFASIFLLGFRLGGEHWQSELAKIRVQAAQAERQIHNLAREAFVSMAEAAQAARHK